MKVRCPGYTDSFTWHDAWEYGLGRSVPQWLIDSVTEGILARRSEQGRLQVRATSHSTWRTVGPGDVVIRHVDDRDETTSYYDVMRREEVIARDEGGGVGDETPTSAAAELPARLAEVIAAIGSDLAMIHGFLEEEHRSDETRIFGGPLVQLAIEALRSRVEQAARDVLKERQL